MDMVERVAWAIDPEAMQSDNPNLRAIGLSKARAVIKAIEATHRLVPRHASHIDAVCPECGTMGENHAPGCAFSATVQPPR